MPRDFDPLALIVPRRKITGISAVLLPFDAQGGIDWPAFEAHVVRTAAAGLTPAVNMDTGYVNLLAPETRLAVLERTRSALGGKSFVAGAFVGDSPGAAWNRDEYLRQMEAVLRHGGTPVVFPSYGLTSLSDEGVVAAHSELGKHADRLIAFELGPMFAPFGRIYSRDVYRGLMGIRACIGAKHSSLRRDLEWERIVMRNETRPEFHVFTGNDLAIDMVIYGSDYLLGLSTFAPDVFARRDASWEAGDPAFYELNDTLQYLGCFAFRAPVPAYKHSAAMFLKLRGWLASDRTHPASPARPDSDREILRDIARRLNIAAEG